MPGRAGERVMAVSAPSLRGRKSSRGSARIRCRPLEIGDCLPVAPLVVVDTLIHHPLRQALESQRLP